MTENKENNKKQLTAIIKKLELIIKNDHQIRDQHLRIRGFMRKFLL
jgi:hypothetical protein